MSTPEMPSTSAWCVLPRIAKRSPSSPSTSHSSHSGLLRSSCCEKARPARCLSCSSLPGGGQRVVLHVVAGVEVRVVDPHRAALAERDEREPLAVARHEVQARLDVRDELVVRRRRPVEHHARGDVHVRRGVVLEVQEGAVEPRQAVAVGHAGHSGSTAKCEIEHTWSLPRPWYAAPTSTCRVVAARCGDERGNHLPSGAIPLGWGESAAAAVVAPLVAPAFTGFTVSVAQSRQCREPDS